MPNESDSTALVEVARNDGLELMTSHMGALETMGKALKESGMCPNSVKSWQSAVAIVLMGRELGMGPMAALRSIHVISGKPTLDASAQLARAIRAGVVVDWKETSEKIATLVLSRAGKSFTSTWTIDMAKSAGLLNKDGPWKSQPWAMLRARAITSGIRAFCPDVLDTGGALYSPDEVEDIGRVEVVAKAPAWTPGEHHATFAAVAQTYAIEIGKSGQPYGVIADWLESDDSGAARLRKGIAGRANDTTLEEPWRPSWVPPRAREALLTFLLGKNGGAAIAACAAWYAKSGDIDVEFEAVEPDAAAKEKAPPKPRAKAKDAPKSEQPKAEPDLNLTDAERDEMVEEITALEQGVGEAAWKAERSKLSLDLAASVTVLVKHATNLSRRYMAALGDVMSATKATS